MKLTLDKSALHQTVTRAQGAISDRSMAQISLKASKQNNLLEIAANDSVLAIYGQIACELTEEGTIFIPGRLFIDVIKQLPDGAVELSTEKGFLQILAGQSPAEFRMKIPLIEDMVWITPPEVDSSNEAAVSSSKLDYMINQVQFCVEQDSPRNYGSVAFLHRPADNKLRLVGTDGFRLSYCEIEVDLPPDFLIEGICLSKRALQELQRMCQSGYESVRLRISNDKTTLMAGVSGYEIYTRLSSVRFPNYQGVLPTANLKPIRLSRLNLHHVTRRVLLAADKNHALRLRFHDSCLTLSSRTMGSFESKETLKLEDGFKGADTQLAINGKFLTDVFSTVPGEDLTLQFKSENDPIVIIPKEEPKQCRSLHVLVPIKEHHTPR